MTDAARTDGATFEELTQRYEVHGVELAWDRWGAAGGRPLVLCHGFSGSAHDFSLQVAPLATQRPVLALDHRGHGRSTKTHDAATYTIDQLVADLIALLDAEVGGPIDLLGHSMGGRIALGVVLDRPDLVHSLMLMDTSARAFVPDDEQLQAVLATHFEKFDPARGLRDPIEGPEDPLIEARTPADWRARKAELSAGFDPYAYKSLGAALFDEARTSVGDRLGEISCPVTVIVGSEDHPLVEQAPALAADVRDGHLVVIDGAYHSPQLTHATPWAQALNDHLARAAGA